VNISVLVITLSLGMIGLISIPVFAQEFDDLDYEIRGGTILNFEIDSKTATLIISLDARARGELTITLPRYLIDAKSGSDDVDFDIFVSGLKLNSIDETITPFERTVTIPFKRSNSELIITGTHVFSQLPVTQTIQPQSTDEIIISEHLKDTHDGNAELLIFSDTTWSGALQSSSFDYTDVDGQNNDSVIFGCESSLGRQGVFGAKIKKLTQDGFLKIVVIQNQRIVSQGATTEEFGEILINGNCESESSSAPGGGGCLIATATYGSEMAPQVQLLRELRDNTLLKSESGTIFMNSFNAMYYSFSPVIADLERENPLFKEAVKLFITPMISSLSILNYVEMDSEESVLGYGISLIILNLAMYVGIPASVIIGIKKKF
jgi:hypothetical protein